MTRLEQIKARMIRAETDGWFAVDKPDGPIIAKKDQEGEEVTVLRMPNCSAISHNKAEFLTHAPDDLASLLRIAEAAERWEEADVKLYAAEKSVPPGLGKLTENISHNYHTALDEWGRARGDMATAVRAFREGGSEG